MSDTKKPEIEKVTPGAGSSSQGQVDSKILELLVCPLTKEPLHYDRNENELISKKAQLAYPIRDGVPIMLIDDARKLTKEQVERY